MNHYTSLTHEGTRTLDQIAALAGCGTSNVRLRILAGKPVAGHVWTLQGEPRKPAAPRGKVTRLQSPGYDGTVTYAELQALGGFAHDHTARTYVYQGRPIAGRVWTVVGDGRQVANPIVCYCHECGGRFWSLDEVRSHPEFPGGPINGMTLRKIGTAVGHPIAYQNTRAKTVGDWHKASDAPAPAPRPDEGRRLMAWESELQAVNERLLSASDGPAGVVI